MSGLPPVPADVVWVSPTVDVGPTSSSFAWWMLWPGLGGGDAVWANHVITDFVTNLAQSFLNVMHSDASIRTCRLRVGGSPPFRFEELLAPNHGALTPGVLPAVSAGLYVQSSGGGRGSGSRVHIPGIGNEMTTDFAYLSDYGAQQLQFAADALVGWPAQLALYGYGTPVLGTLQRRDAGANLPVALFDPAQVVRPTLRLETTPRRQHQIQGLSP